jgi:Ca-activated chloride channel homolog
MTFMSYFEWPVAVAIAIALAGAVAWLVSEGVRRRRVRLAALGTPAMIERLAPGALRRDSRWRLARLAGVALLAGLALAGPRWGAQETAVRQSGVDVVLALDASLSMLAPDERPSRLERMREEIRRLRARSPGDRFAVLAFAGRSYVLSPPTLDHAGLELFLDNLDPGIVGTAGTALAPPIRQATTLLGLSRGEADQAIVLMSDGEGFDDRSEVVDAAREARRRGIHLITVGFGTEQGANIPVRVEGRAALHRDQAGQVVVTRYEPDMLRLAAQSAAGEFIPAESPDRAAAIRTALDRLRAEQRTVRSAEFFALRYQWFLFPALVLLVIDSLLATRALRRRAAAVGSASATAPATEPATTGTGTSRATSTSATRPGAGIAAAVLLLILGGCDPYRLMRDPHVAAYNRGTRLLEADSLEGARRFLRTALESQREEVLHRAGFNMGLTYLVEGLALEAEAADAPLDSALVHYKAVLLRRPSDMDAKWNYELALRNRTGGGGGGGGGAGGGGGGAEDPQPQPAPQGITPQPRHGLSVDDAERILDAVADQERDVQGRNQRRTVPQPPPLGKDW